MAGSVVSSLVSSRLDFLIMLTILYGTSLKNINRLQRIQYSLARVVDTGAIAQELPLPVIFSKGTASFSSMSIVVKWLDG